MPVLVVCRFGHPRADVVARYTQANIPLVRTDRDGAIDLSFSTSAMQVRLRREQARRYWHGR